MNRLVRIIKQPISYWQPLPLSLHLNKQCLKFDPYEYVLYGPTSLKWKLANWKSLDTCYEKYTWRSTVRKNKNCIVRCGEHLQTTKQKKIKKNKTRTDRREEVGLIQRGEKINCIRRIIAFWIGIIIIYSNFESGTILWFFYMSNKWGTLSFSLYHFLIFLWVKFLLLIKKT